jgi:hypothetical protein
MRNKMTDGWLNDLMVCYIEREIYKRLNFQQIKKAFQNKKTRQMQLPRSPRPRRNYRYFLFHKFNIFFRFD